MSQKKILKWVKKKKKKKERRNKATEDKDNWELKSRTI